MNLPPGFELEEQMNLPPGFELEGAPKPSVEDSAWEGLKGVGETALQLGSSALNFIPAGFSGAVHGIAKGSMAAGLDAMHQVQDAWTYEPTSKIGQKYSKATGDFIENATQGISNVVSKPMLAGTDLAYKHGLLSEKDYLRNQNVFQTGGRAGTELVLNTVPIPSLGVAAHMTGSAVKRIGSKGKPKFNPELLGEAPAVELPVGEQLDMFPNHEGPGMNLSPQQIAEMQARQTGQADMFAPVNEPLPHNVGQVSPDAPRVPTMQDELPLHMTPEQIAAQQVDPRQADMFAGNRLPDVVEPPVGRMPTHQDTLPDFTTPEEIAARQADPAQPDLFMQHPPVEPKIEAPRPLTEFGTGERTGYTGVGQELFPERPRDVAVPERPSIETAVDKLASNQHFDMTATEKIAWDKAKGLVEQFDEAAGKGALSDRQIAQKIMDRQWIKEAMDKAHQVEAMYKDVEARAQSIQEKKAIRERLAAVEDQLTQLGEHLAAKDHKVNLQGQGPKTRAAQEAQNPGFRTGVPKSQRGGVDVNAVAEATGKIGDWIRKLAINSPEVLEASEGLARDAKRSAIAGSSGLDAYRRNIDSAPKVIAASVHAKDIRPDQAFRGKTVGAGANNMAINSNNPVIKYMALKVKQAEHFVDNMGRKYITDPKTGLRDSLYKMKGDDAITAHTILMKGDQEKRFITPEEMRRAGAPEHVVEFVKKVYEADAAKLEYWNKQLRAMGMKEVDQLPGHFPGVFRGDYKMFMYGKPHKDGTKPVKYVLTADTEWGLKAQKKAIEEHFKGEEISFSEMDRRALGGNGQRSDLFSGMSDMIATLARHNPEFAKLQQLTQGALAEQTNAMYGAHFHGMAKKGVGGSEGNKLFVSPDKNAKQAMDAFLRYWEEGMMAHAMMPVTAEMKALLDHPSLDHMPLAKKYVGEYMRNVTGSNVGTVGDALNKLVDAPFKYGLRVGPSTPRFIIQQGNKRAGQWAMGFLNIPFAAMQGVQLIQMAIPELMRSARLAGLNQFIDPVKGMGKTLMQSPSIVAAHMGMDNKLSPLMKEAVAEAKKRGINQFSEFQDVNQLSQSKGGRAFDKSVDALRGGAENITRSTMFYTAVNMLEDAVKQGKLPKEEIFDVAYSITQAGMIDYSHAERPMMYQRLGAVGQLAGSLATFKHGMLGQQGKFIKDAFTTNPLKGGWAPLAYSAATAAALMGVKGLPGYQELDAFVQMVTNWFGKEPKNIEEIAMSDSKDWVKYGALSAETGINFSSRLSAANLIPNSIPEMISPYANMYGDIGSAAYDVAKTPGNPQMWGNLATSVTPNFAKGAVEQKLKMRESTEGPAVMNRQGQLGNPRSERDMELKRMGLTSLEQSKQSEPQYFQQQRQKARQDAQKAILTGVEQKINTGYWNDKLQKEALTKYMAKGGDPQSFINYVVKVQTEKSLPRQRRLEGIPSDSLSSINRHDNYNR